MEHPTAPPAPARTLSRRAFLALSGCAFASALAGCSANKNVVVEVSDVEQAGVQLTFFGNKYEPLNVNAIEAILRSYMDEHPDVSIVYESIKGASYYDALEKRLSTDHSDDVFVVDHDTVLAFADTGCLAPLDTLSTIGSFSALALGQMRSEGAIYYVPTSVSAFGLYCNSDLLKAHHVDVPDSFPALLDACATFQNAGIAPLVANNDISLKTLALARGLADTYARDDAEARIAALTDDPRGFASLVRSGFDAVEELVARGYIDAEQALVTEKTSDDLELFAQGAHPFMLTGAWASARVHDMAPDLAFEVHPLPALDDGASLVVNVDTRVSMHAHNDNLETVTSFLEHLTAPESIEPFANSMCSFSPLVGNAPPDDASLTPLSAAFADGHVVIGSDDNLRLPVWSALRACVTNMLEGDTAAQAEAQLARLLAPEAGDAA